MVKGVKFPLDDIPVQERVPRQYNLEPELWDVVDVEIYTLMKKGVLKEVRHVKGEYISCIFLRPKPNGKFRMILDLTKMNKHITKEHFKMASLATAIQMMRPGCFMASVDLREAYLG